MMKSEQSQLYFLGKGKVNIKLFHNDFRMLVIC